MAIAFSTAATLGTLSTSLTLSVTIPANGTVLVSMSSSNANDQVTSLTDTAGNSYLPVRTQTFGGTRSHLVYMAQNTAPATSITATMTQPGLSVMASVYTGVVSVGQSLGATGTSTSSSLTITTQDADNWLVMLADTDATTVSSTATAGTQRVQGPNPGAVIDNTVALAGSLSTTNTWNGGIPPQWTAIGVELRSVASIIGIWPSYGPKLHGRPNPVSRFRSTRYPGAFDVNAQEIEQRKPPSFWTSPGTFRRGAPDPTNRFVSPLAYLQASSQSISPSPSFWAAPGAFFPSLRNKFTSPQAFLRGPDPAPPGSASFWRSAGPSRFAKAGPVSRFRSPQSYFTPTAAPPTNYLQSIAGALASVGDLIKQTGKVLSGSLTSSGAIVKAALKVLSGAMTSGGAIVKQTQALKAGTLASTGALVRQTQKILAAALTSSGALVNRTGKVLAAALTSAGTLAATKVALKALAGTLTSAGALTKQAQKLLAGGVVSAGALAKRTSTSLSGTLAPIGTTAKRMARALSGALSFIGAFLLGQGQPEVSQLSGRQGSTKIAGQQDAIALPGRKDDSGPLSGTQ